MRATTCYPWKSQLAKFKSGTQHTLAAYNWTKRMTAIESVDNKTTIGVDACQAVSVNSTSHTFCWHPLVYPVVKHFALPIATHDTSGVKFVVSGTGIAAQCRRSDPRNGCAHVSRGTCSVAYFYPTTAILLLKVLTTILARQQASQHSRLVACSPQTEHFCSKCETRHTSSSQRTPLVPWTLIP